MDILTATSTLIDLMNTATNMISQAQVVSGMIAKAQSEGRAIFTDEEWTVIKNQDDLARKQLVDAISKALLK